MEEVIVRSTVYGVNPKIPAPELRPRCQHPGCNTHAHISGTKKDGSPIYRKWCASHHDKRTAAKYGLKSIAEITAQRLGKTISEYRRDSIAETARRAGKTTSDYRRDIIAEIARRAGKTISEYRRDSIAETARRAGKTISDYRRDIREEFAKKNGHKSYTDYKNTKHPSLQYRKDYCENIDGRLGFVCTTSNMPEEFGKYWLDVDHIDGNPKNEDPSNYQTLCKCCHSYKTWKFKDYKTPGRKKLGIKY